MALPGRQVPRAASRVSGGAVTPSLETVKVERLVDYPCPICNGKWTRVVRENTLEGRPPSFGYNFNPDYTRAYRHVLCAACRHIYASPRPPSIEPSY